MPDVQLVTGTGGYCSACGMLIFAYRPRLAIGPRMYCAPIGSPCHRSGVRSGGWTFTPADARDLLAADIADLRRRGARSVDPAPALPSPRRPLEDPRVVCADA